MRENMKQPSPRMMNVTFRHYWRVKYVLEEGRWFFGAPWMPEGKEYTIEMPIDSFTLMKNEKDEGDSVPNGESYHNARRYYRMVVMEELNKGVPNNGNG